MLCPKCKKEIPDKSLKCNFCNTKIGTICSACKTYNPITAINCSNCNKLLLKICTECGSANYPDAQYCRKCKIEFVGNINEQPNSPTHTSTLQNSQQNVKANLLEGIKNADSRIITLYGESGSGKNIVLRTVMSELKNAKIVWLMGNCSQVTQLSPFGYFQDLLLSFFNINNFCPDTLQLKKNSIKFFRQDFPALNNSEIMDLLNLLYPENNDIYENLYYNKSKMFAILKKVFLTIIEKTKVIFVIDKFEYIDGISYDFIKELLKEEIIQEKSKFVILTSGVKSGQAIFTSPHLEEDNYLDLSIAPFTSSQIKVFLKQYPELKFGTDFLNLATKISRGNPSILEQLVLLNLDLKRNDLKNISYSSLDDIMRYRLEILKEENLEAYRILIAMSVLGVKFYPAMLENFDNNSMQDFENNIEYLVNKCYITQLNSLAFEFKTQEIWKSIVSIVKNDIIFEEVLNILYETLCIYKQSSIALLGYILQKLKNNDQAFEIWTQLMKQASYIGDIGLYIITQKQALKLIENKTNPFFQNVKRNIYMRVGKLLEPTDDNSAFEFLQKAILMLSDDEIVLNIELLGYLASSAMKSGNFCGVIECIESVLSILPDTMSFQKVLVKSKLIRPLLNLGNYGQLINIVETELLSEIEKILQKGKSLSFININNLFEVWLGIYFDYAEALIYQGDNRCFDVIQIIYDILDKNKITEPALLCRINLLLALANTIKGDIKTSTKILDDILREYSLDNMDSFIVSRWNFIDILNKFFLKEYSTLHSELFNVVAYANNVNDNFTKNILKTLLAKILKENNQSKKALEILEEQVAYFAKEKVAVGVLLSWYLIAEIKLITKGTQFALDVATKALDIAQSPSINNYYFIALFNKLISDIYLAKQDFESAKVYLEKTIFLAKQFDMQYVLVMAYLQSAKLYQELALPKSSKRAEYIKNALKMFQNAKNIPIVQEQLALQRKIKEELSVLTSFCKLNGIILKKENN